MTRRLAAQACIKLYKKQHIINLMLHLFVKYKKEWDFIPNRVIYKYISIAPYIRDYLVIKQQHCRISLTIITEFLLITVIWLLISTHWFFYYSSLCAKHTKYCAKPNKWDVTLLLPITTTITTITTSPKSCGFAHWRRPFLWLSPSTLSFHHEPPRGEMDLSRGLVVKLIIINILFN